MVDVLQELIDKQDTFEIVRDQIAAILVAETANQVALATTAGKTDPNEWNLRVFTERSNPWAEFQERDDTTNTTPIVNVWYESSTFDGSKGNVVHRQQAEGRYNIDIMAVGVSKDDGATGQIAGDKDASLNLARAERLVRNILMASQNTYLQLRGQVGKRWPESINNFQPEQDTVQNLAAGRFILRVDFNEFSPQYVPETLEEVAIDIIRTEDGEIVLQAEYDLT